jgi:AraC-like DNA-binding protein
VLAEPTWDAQIETAVAQLRELLPPRDPVADQVAALVQQILDDREICKVDDLVRRCGRSARTLQRLFGDYVGVSPKWVIQRYRLHEAVARIHGGGADWAAMALELGYFDQAHFIRDFKAVVGRTPRKYGAEEPPGTAPAIGPPRRRAGS